MAGLPANCYTLLYFYFTFNVIIRATRYCDFPPRSQLRSQPQTRYQIIQLGYMREQLARRRSVSDVFTALHAKQGGIIHLSIRKGPSVCLPNV